MFALLRLKVLQRVFGEGIGAAVAGAILSSALERFNDMVNGAERYDSTRLRPGETYTVSVRPPYSHRERKLRRARAKVAAQYAKATAPGRRARRVARKYATAQRRVDRTAPGSARWERRAGKANALVDRYEALTPLSKKARRLRSALDGLDRCLAEEAARTKGHLSAGARRRTTLD